MSRGPVVVHLDEIIAVYDGRPAGGRVKCAAADLPVLKGACHGDVNETEEKIALYNGRRCVGHYVERAGSWLASGADHQVLGAHPTRKAAIDAILDAGVLA